MKIKDILNRQAKRAIYEDYLAKTKFYAEEIVMSYNDFWFYWDNFDEELQESYLNCLLKGIKNL